jgi:hypothetical protein
LALAGLVAIPFPLEAQRPLPSGKLRIIVLEGQDAVNSVPSKTAVSPVVQVVDSLEDPVEGADVTFEVAPTGSGGTFAGGKYSATARTDARGQAAAAFTPNGMVGTFTIKVTASIGGLTAVAQIRQTNDIKALVTGTTLPKPWYRKRKWQLLMAAGVAGGITAIVLTQNSSSSSNTKVNVAPGTVVIGGPQ